VIPAFPLTPLAFPGLALLLYQLGYEMVRGYKKVSASGKAQANSAVFRSVNGVDVEVKIDAEGKIEICVDEEQLRAKEGIEREDLAGKIVQGLSYQKVIEQLEAQGYTIVEEQELDTGSIRLVVRKWS
ncbi:MAG: DUF1257 domain-containing protein, partial [Candidatus Dadabacteria bacterium]|nr:DUF1257 domain-containing protein [Candidatus Dadabacteria bacterium]